MVAKTAGLLVDDVCREIYELVNEGLQDVANNQLIDFDTVFNELERRYVMDD